MNKYQVSFSFTMDENFMSYVPEHRTYINDYINKHVIEYYSVSIEAHKCWMIINAASKQEVQNILNGSVLNTYWHNVEIDTLFVYDSAALRWPELIYN
jgi:hypothetical protein